MRATTLFLIATVVALFGVTGKSGVAAAADCALPTVSVAGTDQYEGSGGGANRFVFTVRVSPVEKGCAGAGSVRYRTVDRTAVAGSDYVATDGVISWSEPTSRDVLVSVGRDDAPEYDEDFAVELFDPRDVRITGSTAVVAVINDDKLPDKTFPGVEIAMPEGGICWWPDDTYFKLPLWVNVTPKAPITVRLYGKDGTALAGKHYDFGQSTVTFPTGVTKVDIPIKILAGPNDAKEDLYFYVVIDDVSAGVVRNGAAKITIRQG